MFLSHAEAGLYVPGSLAFDHLLIQEPWRVVTNTEMCLEICPSNESFQNLMAGSSEYCFPA